VNWLVLLVGYLLTRDEKREQGGAVPVLVKGASGTLWQLTTRDDGTTRVDTTQGEHALTYRDERGQRVLTERTSSPHFGAALLDFKIREHADGAGIGSPRWLLATR
jgi:hypothetical protein